MSLYNAICGFHPYADRMLTILDLKRDDIHRFRDCHLFKRGNRFRILVYSRVGHAGAGLEKFNAYKKRIEEHPAFVKSREDPNDPTFLCCFFDVGELYLTECQEIWEETGSLPDPIKRYQEIIMLINQEDVASDDPKLEKSMVVGRQIMDEVIKAKQEAERRDETMFLEMVDSDLEESLCEIPGRLKIVVFSDGTVKRVCVE